MGTFLAIGFQSLIRHTLRKGLRGVYLRGTLPDPAVILAPNHHSWWDGYLMGELCWQHRHLFHLMMLDRQLQKYSFFRLLGVISEKQVREALKGLKAGHHLVIFPEGALRPAGQVQGVQNGVGWLARQSGCPVVPVAIRTVLRGHQHPEAYINIGLPCAADALQEQLNMLLTELDTALGQGDPEQPLAGYSLLMAGVGSDSERMQGSQFLAEKTVEVPVKRLITVFLLTKIGIGLVNLVFFPRLKAAAVGSRPKVSLLVPARNEAHNLRHTLPLLLDLGADEVIVLDDGSQDGTASVVQELQALHPELRLLTGLPLPAGWVGKNWACHQLSLQARGEVIVFTDADVFWQPTALKRVLARLTQSQADLLSVYPRQQTHTLSERVLVPLIDDVLLCFFPYLLIRLPFGAASAGNGQVMVFRRESYHRIGGHQRVKNQVLEDVELARKTKRQGGKLSLALGRDQISVRMYQNYPEVIEGFGKNLRAFHGNSPFLMLFSAFVHLSVYTLPLLVPSWRNLWFLGMLERLLVNFTTGRTRGADLLEVLTPPLGPLLSLPIYLRSLQKTYQWKGRSYARDPRETGEEKEAKT